jgi:hypothetical protein
MDLSYVLSDAPSINTAREMSGSPRTWIAADRKAWWYRYGHGRGVVSWIRILACSARTDEVLQGL